MAGARANAKRAEHPELQDHFSATVNFSGGRYAVVAQSLGGWEHHQTVKASKMEGDKEGKEGKDKDRAADGKSYSGVYIAGQDYFCLSLEGSHGVRKGDKETRRESEEKRTSADAGKGEGSSSGSFILILRRGRAGKLPTDKE